MSGNDDVPHEQDAFATPQLPSGMSEGREDDMGRQRSIYQRPRRLDLMCETHIPQAINARAKNVAVHYIPRCKDIDSSASRR